MEYIEIIKKSTSVGNAALNVFGYSNKKTQEKIKSILSKNGLDQSIFDRNKRTNIKYRFVIKVCPVCEKEFETQIGKRKEKTTCSIGCSNSHKPKRKKNPNVPKSRKVKNVSKDCEFCGKEFYGPENVKCCSKSCANELRRKRMKNPKKKNSKKKSDYKKVCPICNSDFLGTQKAKTCSKICRDKLLSIKMKKRVADGLHKGWTTRPIASYPEKFFMKVLENNNIEYKFNHPVSKSSLGITNAACYFLDFYIEINGRKVDLEIDGKQHLMPERKESDTVRDKLLKKAGYEVYRIPWKNINRNVNKEYIKNEIKKLINFFTTKDNCIFAL